MVVLETYVKLGWIKLSAFAKLTGISEIAVKRRKENVNYPAWRVGAGMVKLLRDGHYVNYEEYLKWAEKQPSVAA